MMSKSKITISAAMIGALFAAPAIADPPAVDAKAICAKAKTPGECLAERAGIAAMQTNTAFFLYSLDRADMGKYRAALAKQSDARREIEAVAEWAREAAPALSAGIDRCAEDFAAGIDETAPKTSEPHSRWNDRTASIERTISRACDRLRPSSPAIEPK